MTTYVRLDRAIEAARSAGQYPVALKGYDFQGNELVTFTCLDEAMLGALEENGFELPGGFEVDGWRVWLRGRWVASPRQPDPAAEFIGP